MKVLILLSGGIDSATVLALARKHGHECHALFVDYDQPHRIEMRAARAIAFHYGAGFELVDLPCLSKTDDVVFAGRNLLLAAAAISMAQARGVEAIGVGCNESDWLRFPDCRPPFWKAVGDAAEAYGVKVWAPLLHMPKSDVVGMARELGVPLHLTWSCYAPTKEEQPCGECLACTTRAAAGA